MAMYLLVVPVYRDNSGIHCIARKIYSRRGASGIHKHAGANQRGAGGAQATVLGLLPLEMSPPSCAKTASA